MTVAALESPCVDIESSLFKLYRSFFDRAEKKRRWSLTEDIPWSDCNANLDPAVADLVETFCLVEMHLPDYVANAMRGFRASRACSWFYANWAYEESKHSMALGDWLLRSRSRTDEQLADLSTRVFDHPWKVPHDSPIAMLAYAMVQELATGLTYRNLRHHVRPDDDPALSRLLGFLSVDEQAHHNFFLKTIQLFLEHDRPGTLTQLRRVMHGFTMPAVYEMVDGARRVAAIEQLRVFDGDKYVHDVYQPILTALDITRAELRRAA
jgi:acyl-[acyl-carrier-protein] desaturase